jgi:hypothetical protein
LSINRTIANTFLFISLVSPLRLPRLTSLLTGQKYEEDPQHNGVEYHLAVVHHLLAWRGSEELTEEQERNGPRLMGSNIRSANRKSQGLATQEPPTMPIILPKWDKALRSIRTAMTFK